MKKIIVAAAFATLALAATSANAGSYLEPNVQFNCQISSDKSKTLVERMFTSCGWGMGLTLKRKEEHNTYNNYEGDTTNNSTTNNTTVNKTRVVKKKTVKKKVVKKKVTKNTTINDNSFNPTINNPNTVNIY